MWNNAGTSKFPHFRSRKCIWKCRLRNGGPIASVSMYWLIRQSIVSLSYESCRVKQSDVNNINISVFLWILQHPVHWSLNKHGLNARNMILQVHLYDNERMNEMIHSLNMLLFIWIAQCGETIYSRVDINNTHITMIDSLPLEDLNKFSGMQFSSYFFNERWLRYLLRNPPHMNVTGTQWWTFNICSGIALVSSDNKPIPEPILTHIISLYGVARPQWV